MHPTPRVRVAVLRVPSTRLLEVPMEAKENDAFDEANEWDKVDVGLKLADNIIIERMK